FRQVLRHGGLERRLQIADLEFPERRYAAPRSLPRREQRIHRSGSLLPRGRARISFGRIRRAATERNEQESGHLAAKTNDHGSPGNGSRQSSASVLRSRRAVISRPLRLRPLVCAIAERSALGVDDAEALSGGRFHDPPASDVGDASSAQGFEPLYFCLEVV